MRRYRNAKIVATLGPASSDRTTIEALFDAGADVFRLNFSHGTHADSKGVRRSSPNWRSPPPSIAWTRLWTLRMPLRQFTTAPMR